MKKFWLATVGLAALGIAAPASAADMCPPYTKAPPPLVGSDLRLERLLHRRQRRRRLWSNKCWDVTNFRGPRRPLR